MLQIPPGRPNQMNINTYILFMHGRIYLFAFIYTHLLAESSPAFYTTIGLAPGAGISLFNAKHNDIPHGSVLQLMLGTA